MGQHTHGYLSLPVFLLSLCWVQRSDADGQRSSCEQCDQQFFYNCSYSGFVRVPEVSDRALTLDLSFNTITEVTDDDLTGHRKLRALSLRGNGLAVIHPSASDPLWSLEDLDLSDNNLSALNHEWFNKLGALQQLNLLNNPYSCLGSPPVFQSLVRLRRLAFGGPALLEIKRGDLSGVTELEELTLHANHLKRYESGSLADIWPLGHVTLSLQGPFATERALASAVIADVAYPNTPIVLQEVYLVGAGSVEPLRELTKRRIRSATLRNVTISDEEIVEALSMLDGVPLTFLSLDDVVLTGEGRWAKGNQTHLSSLDEVFVRHMVILDLFKFIRFAEYFHLLHYPRKISVINAETFVVNCPSTFMVQNLQYADLSDNLVSDLALQESLCHGNSPLKDLRVLNISGNFLRSLSTLTRMVANFTKLTHLDISRNGYSSMPQSCSWPHSLRYLNISWAKLREVTSCLPTTLEVLDLSYNSLKNFSLFLPVLRELYLSGNKFLSLPHGRLFPNLEILWIKSNTMNMFGPSDLQSYSRLQSLQAGQNKFVCSCDFVSFLQSAFKNSGEVQITDREESYVCDSPLYLQGGPVSRVSLSVVECHQVLFVSVSCGVALCVVLLVSILLWRLHVFWYLKMTCAWVKAKRCSHQRRKRDRTDREALLSFDAFVSYSERDASWVENYLVPELEQPGENGEDSSNSRGPRPLTLCLHKRDFLPGHWIMDNIMSAIERSRRTIFVLSENFVQSDWCRYELDFSHFWLFDGNAGDEAAILILLEPLSRDNIPKRFYKLHKLMRSTTYLEWPQEEERVGEFWKSLRRALRVEEEDDG